MFFCIEIFNWDLEKMSVVPPRPVRYIEVSLMRILYETNPFMKKVSAGSVRYRISAIERFHYISFRFKRI